MSCKQQPNIQAATTALGAQLCPPSLSCSSQSQQSQEGFATFMRAPVHACNGFGILSLSPCSTQRVQEEFAPSISLVHPWED